MEELTPYPVPETTLIPVRADVIVEATEVKITFFTPVHAYAVRMPRDDGLALARYILENVSGIEIASADKLPVN